MDDKETTLKPKYNDHGDSQPICKVCFGFGLVRIEQENPIVCPSCKGSGYSKSSTVMSTPDPGRA